MPGLLHLPLVLAPVLVFTGCTSDYVVGDDGAVSSGDGTPECEEDACAEGHEEHGEHDEGHEGEGCQESDCGTTGGSTPTCGATVCPESSGTDGGASTTGDATDTSLDGTTDRSVSETRTPQESRGGD